MPALNCCAELPPDVLAGAWCPPQRAQHAQHALPTCAPHAPRSFPAISFMHYPAISVIVREEVRTGKGKNPQKNIILPDQ